MIVYFLAVVYCNRDSKLETSVILPVLLAASPLQAPSTCCPETQFAKYVDLTDSYKKCCPDRPFVKKEGARNDNLQYLQEHDFEQNNKEIVQKNEQRQLKKVLQIEE